MEISWTQLRVYGECPRKYRLIFLEGKRIPLDPPSSLGASLHRALESYHRGEGELLERYDRLFVGGGYPDEETKKRWLKKGRRMLEKYLERDADRRTKVLYSEYEFSRPLGRHSVRGMIDRVDELPEGGHELIDYKTWKPDSAEGRRRGEAQMRFYALGAGTALRPKALTFHYLAEDQVESFEAKPCDEGEVLGVADLIEAEKFDCPSGASCPQCRLPSLRP